MGEDELIVLIVFGSIFGIVVVSQLISLAKKWIERNNSSYDDKAFDRLAKAFIQHKKESERRLQNLEAIITDDDPESLSGKSKQKPLQQNKSSKSIEIDNAGSGDKNSRNKSEDGNLRNMLKE